jgi:hypothetical protein
MWKPPAIEGADLVASQRAEPVEAPEHEAGERVVATGHHRVGLPAAQQIRPQSQGGGSGGASGGDRDHRALCPQPAGQAPGRSIVEGVGQPSTPPVSRQRLLPLLDSPESGAHHHRDPRGIERQRPQAGLRAQIVGGGDQEPGGPAVGHPAPVLDAAELLDLAAALHTQVAQR